MAAAARRPNILILMADQLTPFALPAYGNAVVQAPVMAALARDGVVFDAAYCNSPLCAPSRAVFMSGRLPSAIGAYDNAAEFPADIPTFAHALRAPGYRTILSGKMHFCGADQLHGFEERLTTDIYPADFGWTPDWDRPEERPSWYHNMALGDRCRPLHPHQPAGFRRRGGVRGRAPAVRPGARAATDRPFCMVVSLTHPHDPFAVPERYWDLHRDEDIDAARGCAGRRPAFAPAARTSASMDRDADHAGADPRAPAAPITAPSPMSTSSSAG